MFLQYVTDKKWQLAHGRVDSSSMEELIVLQSTLNSFFCHLMTMNDDGRDCTSTNPHFLLPQHREIKIKGA